MSGPPPPLPLPVPGALPPPPPMPHPPPMNTGPMPSGRIRGNRGSPFTNNLILMHMPPVLQSLRSLRDWLYPCGSTRSAVIYSPDFTAQKLQHQPSPQRNNEIRDKERFSLDEAKQATVMLTTSHNDGALKIMGAMKEFNKRLENVLGQDDSEGDKDSTKNPPTEAQRKRLEAFRKVQAYMVPSSPDIPLPPPMIDEETIRVLGERLLDHVMALVRDEDTAANQTRKEPESPLPITGKLVDVSKAAAAAGGGQYDTEEDPLNAPAVLAAVRAFRDGLQQQQSSQSKRRQQLVYQRLQQARGRVREAMQKEKERRDNPEPSPLPPPPPPTPTLAAPNMPGDSGKRGRSNLPAWMTQQQADAGEPEAKKQKASDGTAVATHFPPLPPTAHDSLRTFVTEQIVEFLGEADATLIDFCVNHIVQQQASASLLAELETILQDEAPSLLEKLWSKVRELQ